MIPYADRLRRDLYNVRAGANMRAYYLAGWLIAGLLASSAAQAQTTTPITLSFSGTMNGVISGDTGSATFAGVGNVTPFGPATFAGTLGCLPGCLGVTAYQPFTFSLASGGSFQIAPDSFGCCGFIDITATFAGMQIADEIIGGTGAFQNASGSFALVLPAGTPALGIFCSPVASSSQPPCPTGFQFTGTGSITTPGTIFVSPSAFPFSFLQGSTASSLSLSITNGTSQSVTFSATTSSPSWLSVSLPDSVAAFSSATATVTVNPASLTPGTYTATVTLATSGQQFVVPVTVTISSAELAIAISQTALRFQVGAGASAPPDQSITVLNAGAGTLNWSAKASTLFGSWLLVSPSAGVGDDTATVSVVPANLAAGDYYGLVKFTATGAANSPQAAVVVLNVLPATTAVPTAEPTGLIFVGEPGGANPAAQTVTVSNPSNQSITVTPTVLAQQNGIFSTTPSGSTTVTSAQPAQFMVSANLTGLSAGVYPGVIQFVFGDGSVQQVALALIVTPSGGAPDARAGIRAAAASGCTPTQLIPVSTGLGQSFTEPAAWPTPLIIQVVDDCGSAMGPGTVVASFSNGDPQLSLVSLGDGMWSGTWEPRYTASAASVVITVQAQSSKPVLMGTVQISGTLNPNQSAPAISNGGVVSAASFAANAPLAPGGFISIFGSNFAAGLNSAGTLPLGTSLGGTQVIVAGEPMPLLFTGTGQINAIIPYDIAPNATQQLIVQQNLAYSLPEAITLAPAQPAVYTQSQSGTGIGVIVVVQPDGTQFEADSSHPASAGDALVIYCTGLGAVNPLVAAGSAAPTAPPAKTSTTVTATIGGQPAQVLFAGLTPAFAGLYQVNVLVPKGITAAPNVPVIIIAGGLASPPVTIPIQ
jgi:uncharacterized protein (TIGR03437 family)